MEGDAVMAIAKEWVTDLEQRGVDTSKVLIHSTGDTEFFVPPSEEERRTVRARLGVPKENIAIGFFLQNGVVTIVTTGKVQRHSFKQFRSTSSKSPMQPWSSLVQVGTISLKNSDRKAFIVFG